MWKVLFRARERFDRDQRGNVAILFAFTAVPLIGLLGGAVDVTRHQRYKTEILNAMDATAVALVRQGPETDADADTFVNSYIATMLPGQDRDPMLHMAAFDAIKIQGGYRIVSDGYMDTAFLPVVGIEEMLLDLTSEVMTSGGKYEIALALDNTGSMAEHNKIGALRQAANHMTDLLFADDGAERVKMALVPFTTTVNIRGEAFKPEWLDPSGLGLGQHRFDSYDREVSRLDIFDALSGGKKGADGMPVAWKGCVEARDGDFDVDDTAPGDDPSTRWTPYLSPDGADSGNRPRYARFNSYLLDAGGSNALERMRNVDKYLTPDIIAPFNEASGPNQACRGPIVELNNTPKRMHDAINAMQPGGWTHIPQGLAWGWRVLSPEEPFKQGAEYDDLDTQKALVLLSDGKNTVTSIDYTSYGYLADGRLGSSNENAARRELNEKTTAVCEAIKATGIRLYMILLEENDAATKQIFEDCASLDKAGKPLYYEVPDTTMLTAVFSTIGKDLTNIHISR